MSNTKKNYNVVIDLKRSNILLIIFVFLCISSGISCFANSLQLPLQALLLCAVSAYLYHIYRRHIIYSHKRSLQQVFFRGDSWYLVINQQAPERAELTANFVTNYFAIMQFKTGNKRRYSMLLTKDNCEPGVLRQLKLMQLFGVQGDPLDLLATLT